MEEGGEEEPDGNGTQWITQTKKYNSNIHVEITMDCNEYLIIFLLFELI